ncbi:MAG: class I SAM-dependent methyltransferase [Methylococcaceae bacterium]|nr:class I SAM-dependent methyltransferase [Methylococcaceae bacterium]
MAICNICGNNSFLAGPNGRMSATGVPPRCEKCQSLERHRAYKDIFKNLIDQSYKEKSFIQFSPDGTVEPDWFASYEVSTYGGENSLDLQKIDRDSHSYDIVMCNHVLEHVPYDNSALNELLRITKRDGFVFLTVPSPATQLKTTDWGYPKEEDHGHYRIYGKDFEKILKSYLPHAWILSVDAIDPVTESLDVVYFLLHTDPKETFFTHNDFSLKILQKGLKAQTGANDKYQTKNTSSPLN